jgi:hypothetical protein
MTLRRKANILSERDISFIASGELLVDLEMTIVYLRELPKLVHGATT